MTRELRLLWPRRRRPERGDPDRYNGVELLVVLAYLMNEPIERVRLTDRDALELAAHLIGAVATAMADATGGERT